ncbi:MAG: nucleoside hydrolase [Hyphomonas sp.]
MTWRAACLALCHGLLDGLAAHAAPPERIWIDTDAACDGGARHDPDDCLALYALATSPQVQIVGVSAVFGNAKEVDSLRVLARLADLLGNAGYALPTPLPGADRPVRKRRGQPPSDAATDLCAALEDAPLTIVALGPLTNIADALSACPGHADRISRLIFVGGSHAGHVFHPAEGAMSHAKFGHGPIFRDLNVRMDLDAVQAVFSRDIPVVLTPYVLARQMEIGAADIAAFAERDEAAGYIASASLPWLTYWEQNIGRDGFYPFDLMAAAVLLAPDAMLCSPRRVALMPDRKISPVFPPRGLLFDPPAGRTDARPVLACLKLERGGPDAIRHLLLPPPGDDGHA